ncbi:hypothetical protein KIN20_012836 [Parelaphostrongylus tenuis]|uniref:Uncharacterized protein n=1 Tax=Parelaphostrongylus tenuis TaxID=148309 RepID=A0AAD5N1G0_PARTN|nr:hypothetical protein KIN20_012836 [Parelaphostrongylus tenuis]
MAYSPVNVTCNVTARTKVIASFKGGWRDPCTRLVRSYVRTNSDIHLNINGFCTSMRPAENRSIIVSAHLTASPSGSSID